MDSVAETHDLKSEHEIAEAMHPWALGLMETVLRRSTRTESASMNALAEMGSDQGKYDQVEEVD